jgi:hypothetical protein
MNAICTIIARLLVTHKKFVLKNLIPIAAWILTLPPNGTAQSVAVTADGDKGRPPGPAAPVENNDGGVTVEQACNSSTCKYLILPPHPHRLLLCRK